MSCGGDHVQYLIFNINSDKVRDTRKFFCINSCATYLVKPLFLEMSFEIPLFEESTYRVHRVSTIGTDQGYATDEVAIVHPWQYNERAICHPAPDRSPRGTDKPHGAFRYFNILEIC